MKKNSKDDHIKKEALARERKYIYPVNAHDQGNWRSIHSDEYQSKTDKKYEYY